jgi:NADH:ubiquinone oxidoreductase subunit 5 (subunit L)/multisubunit Na+/H+ antiporter MnhA subunit
VSILIAIVLSVVVVGDVNILTFNNHIAEYQNHYLCIYEIDISIIEIISFFFISSAFIKSAQFGTHI